MIKPIILSAPLLLCVLPSNSQEQPSQAVSKPKPAAVSALLPRVCSACIRAHEEFLASDALNGRGSATHDELVAATYIAAQLRQYGIAPAGDDGGYLQRVALLRRKLSGAPELRFSETSFKHGEAVIFLHAGESQQQGPLQKVEVGAQATPQIQKGAFVMLMAKDGNIPEGEAGKMFKAGAAAVLLPENARYRAHWDFLKQRLFAETLELTDASGKDVQDRTTTIMLSADAAKQLDALPEGTLMRVSAPMDAPQEAATWNAIGQIRGGDPKLRDSAVLLSAHLDHLGVKEGIKGDNIYNGADDDASGTTAVLELARVLGSRPKPRRTVLFALFGSEELGGFGSTYWREHPPVPLAKISANLEFEMIGRADAGVPPDTLWLTGWERSNLGPTLATHGAKLVGDPHPSEQFFTRSDNYWLAQKGIVAQTVSSYGLHNDYHQPSDDLAHLDFKHMDDAIASLLRPVQWLVNSSFKPSWNPGGQP